jgi:hypothetical protein
MSKLFRDPLSWCIVIVLIIAAGAFDKVAAHDLTIRSHTHYSRDDDGGFDTSTVTTRTHSESQPISISELPYPSSGSHCGPHQIEIVSRLSRGEKRCQ